MPYMSGSVSCCLAEG